jgi:undecaprenol kinase
MNRLSLFIRSFKHAVRGLTDVARAEQSFRIQIYVSLVVVSLSWLFSLSIWERILVILLCAAVMVLEVLNSIMERFADAVQPRLSPMVREVKDMMAGAVLLTSVTAGVVGGMIFYPHAVQIVCVIIKFCGGR